MIAVRWDQLKARPINVPLALKVAASCPCPHCGGRLIVDRDDGASDLYGSHGRLLCLLCCREAADVRVRP